MRYRRESKYLLCDEIDLSLGGYFLYEIEFLLAKGADPNASDDDHELPLKKAIKIESFSLCKLLLMYGANPNLFIKEPPLLTACFQMNCRIVELLLKNGADPNAYTDYGVKLGRWVYNDEVKNFSINTVIPIRNKASIEILDEAFDQLRKGLSSKSFIEYKMRYQRESKYLLCDEINVYSTFTI